VVYSWAGEKFAWLVLHPLLPLLLLAGIGVQAIWETRHRWYGAVGVAATAAAFAYAGYASFLVNAEHRADPRELLVATQSSEEVARIADRVVAQAASAESANQPFTITVDSADGATFPYAWYFRDLTVGYPDLTAATDMPTDDVMILTPRSKELLQPDLPDYTVREFPFRVWWLRDNSTLSAGAWIRWFTDRKPWNPTGGMTEWLYERR